MWFSLPFLFYQEPRLITLVFLKEIERYVSDFNTFFLSPPAINYLKEFAVALGFIVLGIFVTFTGVLLVAMFITFIGQSLCWYTHYYVSYFLYGSAALATLIFVHTLANKFYYKVSTIMFYYMIGFSNDYFPSINIKTSVR